MKDKVVLAYSGGLDTSFCVKYLTEEKQLDVYSALANTGGFSENELKDIESKAYELGVTEHTALDVTNRYYQRCIRYMIYGNVLKNNTYPLSVSSERIFQALAIVEYARKIGAKYIAHGSTGAGNDQIRFDLTFQVLAPEIKVIAPIRNLQLSREQEIDFLKKRGINRDWTKMEYSINKGLWGTSVGGKETLTSNQTLPDEAYPSQLQKEGEETLTINFEKGEITKVNGEAFTDKIEAIKTIEGLAASYAVGRDMHVGDTIVGIKGRVGFEAAAPLVIIKAHHVLEKHTLTKWQMHWKEQLGNWYGMFLHESQYLEPSMRDIEKFLESTQRNVTGKVIIKLKPYRFEVVGIESDHDLMSSVFGEYGEMNKAWTASDVEGFTTMLATPMKIYNAVNKGELNLEDAED
ncbi:argininosuccinate synthase [Carboxylicivirga linearis]|uniref:argininosuccinate synthase n=1 Tax=Carboxylicivirga linearis TaxID=1628157 RepID=A0ABS5JQ67_9BACT|nr:argininosuccinate synthase domain-containing protein [Carboxylicivirga linearis]MBS2096953.1 argininosuccinate synthase [Carboxylicivirga linearis]